MAVNLHDANNLSQVLTMLNQSDTKTIKKGEKLLKTFVADPSSVMPLIEQIRGNPDESCRLQASLMLKKKGNYPLSSPQVFIFIFIFIFTSIHQYRTPLYYLASIFICTYLMYMFQCSQKTFQELFVIRSRSTQKCTSSNGIR